MSQQITIAGGCFWCIEAAFNQVKGIISAEPGYSGGLIENPSYYAVISGKTGHAEALQLTFDPALISVREILEIFFSLHDPTQLNRQGNDVGTQYRSAVFFHDEAQHQQTLSVIAQIEKEQIWPSKVVTQVEAIKNFYNAEQAHKDYFISNPENQYCQYIISPKLAKFKATFASKLK